jgi:ribosomal protein S18 acetylase RimI-like enzyme
MAAETESCELDFDKVDRGVAFVLSGKGLASKYWVATDALNEVIGMVGVSPEWSDWWGVEYWWIIAVYVTPSSRRKGIAAKMLRGVLAAAKARGVQTVNLRVEKDNTAAQALYRSVGFAVDPSHLVMACGRTPAGDFVGAQAQS